MGIPKDGADRGKYMTVQQTPPTLPACTAREARTRRLPHAYVQRCALTLESSALIIAHPRRRGRLVLPRVTPNDAGVLDSRQHSRDSVAHLHRAN